MSLLNEKILRLPQVISITGLSPATLARYEQADKFPRRRKIGVRAVGWLESEIVGWLNQQPTYCDSKGSNGALRDVTGYISDRKDITHE